AVLPTLSTAVKVTLLFTVLVSTVAESVLAAVLSPDPPATSLAVIDTVGPVPFRNELGIVGHPPKVGALLSSVTESELDRAWPTLSVACTLIVFAPSPAVRWTLFEPAAHAAGVVDATP